MLIKQSSLKQSSLLEDSAIMADSSFQSIVIKIKEEKNEKTP